VNGAKLTATAGAFIEDGVTYIPLRAVGEALGAAVGWDPDAFAVSVDMPASGAAGSAQSEDAAVTSVIEKVSPSVVAIIGNYSQSSSSWQDSYAEGMAGGTGVVIKSGGEILTNAHVVDGMNSIVVILNDGSAYSGKVKYTDEAADLAVVKIDKLGLPIVTFGDSDAIRTGDTVVAIGTPLSFSLRNSASKGIISGVNRGLSSEYALIQTDAAINFGNSGGPLVNLKGQVVGINSSKFAGVGIEGVGFSIPANTVKYVIDQFDQYGKVRRIGINATLEESWAARRGLPTKDGLKVTGASGTTGAEGLAAGDVIFSIGGVAVHSQVDCNECMKKYKSGDKPEFAIKRGGSDMKLKLTLS